MTNRLLSATIALFLVLPASTSIAAESGPILTGVPEIPADLVSRLTQYESTRWASMRSVADNGSSILITTRLGETGQVHHIKNPGAARTQLTFRREPSRSPGYVPGSDRSFLFSGDIGGDEQYQIFRFDMDSGSTTQLTPTGVRHGGWTWSPDGKHITYTSNQRNGKDFDIWIGDGRSADSSRLLAEGDGYWGAGPWAPDGNSMIAYQYVSRADSRLHLVDVSTGKSTRIIGGTRKDTSYYGDVVFGADEDTLLVTSDRDGEFVRLYRVTRKGKRWKWSALSADIPWDVEELAINEDASTLAFTVNEGGYAALYLVDLKTDVIKRVESIPRGLIYGLRFARKAPVLGFTAAGPTRTGDAWTLNTTSGEVTQWTHSEIGGLDSANFREPELIEYESFDGRKIPAYYYKPAGEGPFPVTIDIHGGPEGQAQPWFSATTQYLLNEAKIAVIVPNVRGSSGYGRSYLALDNGYLREDSVKDIGALLDWVGKQEQLDADRVAVQGGSYGGYMVLACLVHYGDRLRAGIDVVGISNFVTFLENTKEYRRDVRRAEYGDERDPKMRAFLESISPLNQVEKIRSALLVGQGANDPRVPQSEADQIVAAVGAQGHDVWYFLAPDEGHGFAKKSNRDMWKRVSTLFLETTLGVRAAASTPEAETVEEAPVSTDKKE
jgi:dipeptidyl aminopeptidase/acylaminoacyl peptidase